MGNCNCNSNCNTCSTNCNCNCNTTAPVSGCYSAPCGGYNTPNCSCIPCDTPVIVQPGPDLTNQTLIPVLADVLQNCATINRYETAFPTNLIFLTNFPVGTATAPATAPTGTVCITGVSYSYDCIGVPATGESPTFTAPTISGFIDSRAFALTATQASCSCLAAGAAAGTVPTPLYSQFAGTIKTNAYCCNTTIPPTSQQYALSKIVETAVPFSICNLNVTIQGTIGGCPFTATLLGTGTAGATAGTFVLTPIANPTPISFFTFPATLNFAGRMCLPTCTRINIQEQFDNCLTFDCVRPLTATYTDITVTSAGTALDGYYLVAAADLSLIVNKQIYATTTEKLAVLTPVGTEVVCNNGTTIPSCPQPSSPCECTPPCPPPQNPAVTVPTA